MRIKPLQLRARRTHIEGWIIRKKNINCLRPMPVCEIFNKIVTFLSPMLKAQTRMEIIGTNGDSVVGKKITEAYQIRAWINKWLWVVTLVNFLVKTIKHLIRWTLENFSLCYTEVQNICFEDCTSQPSGFLDTRINPALQPSPSSSSRWAMLGGGIKTVPIQTHAQN